MFEENRTRVDTLPQMNLADFCARQARRLALAGAVCACLLAPASATALSRPGDDTLSARLAELARPGVRSLPAAAQAERLGLAEEGPGSLLRAGGRVLAEVRFDDGAAAGAERLRQAGATVVEVSRRYQAVTVAARPADLAAIGAVAGVAGVTEVLAPLARGTDCGGAVRSEGDAQLNAASARTSFGLDGSGLTVGILSDSFDRDPGAATHAPGDVASGDLPGAGSPCGSSVPVALLDDSAAMEAGESGDEGRAMAQIVHDLAPGAALTFASAFTGELAFAANIRALAAAGAKVIADDVTYFEEPFFQDGPVAVAVNDVTAAGVPYFTAAGNDNLIAKGRDIASWETAAFRDSGACPPELAAIPLAGADHCLDFDPGAGVDDTFGIAVASGATLTVDLQWAEPWNGVATDLDAFLLDQAGKPIAVDDDPEEVFVAGGDDNIGVTQRPVEVLQWENDTGSAQSVQLAINRFRRRPAAAEVRAAPERPRRDRNGVPPVRGGRHRSARPSSATPVPPPRSRSGPSPRPTPSNRSDTPRAARSPTTSVPSPAAVRRPKLPRRPSPSPTWSPATASRPPSSPRSSPPRASGASAAPRPRRRTPPPSPP